MSSILDTPTGQMGVNRLKRSGSNHGLNPEKTQQIRDASTPMGGSIYSHGASLLPPLGGVYKTPKWEWTDLDIYGSAEVSRFCHCCGLGYIAVVTTPSPLLLGLPSPCGHQRSANLGGNSRRHTGSRQARQRFQYYHPCGMPRFSWALSAWTRQWTRAA